MIFLYEKTLRFSLLLGQKVVKSESFLFLFDRLGLLNFFSWFFTSFTRFTGFPWLAFPMFTLTFRLTFSWYFTFS